MLGQPISMVMPEVVGFKLSGKLREGATATDLVLTVTQMLRKQGRGRQVRRILRPRPRRTDASPTAPRSATWRRNMAPPAASSRSIRRRCAISPSPAATRSASIWSRPMPRRRACGATTRRRIRSSPTRWSSISARSSRRSPARAGRRIGCCCPACRGDSSSELPKLASGRRAMRTARSRSTAPTTSSSNGDVVIAAITSCTNTSNPSVMVGAGLLARNAVEARA